MSQNVCADQEINMLRYSSVFISLILAGLYALGLTFQVGFMREIGLEETQFVLSVDRIFFQGFVSAAQMGSKGFLYLIGSAASVVIIADLGVLALDWINKTDLRQKLQKIFKKSNKDSILQAKNSFADFALKAFSYSVVAFILYFILLFALTLSDKSGMEWALKFKENARSNKYIVKSIKLHNDTESMKGYSIICNNLQCAYLVNGSAIVLNNRDIEWVKSEE